MIIANSLNTKSWERIAEGSIKSVQKKTPKAQTRLMSLEDLRLRILAINGMLKKGKMTAATIPRVMNISFKSTSFYFTSSANNVSFNRQTLAAISSETLNSS